MNNQWLKARQTKYTAYVTVYILVVIAIIVVANVLADRYNKSYDVTSNQRYSFSEQTVKVVSGLTQDATILYFGRRPFAEAKLLLGRYADLSHKLHIEYIDMESDPQKARANNVVKPDTAIVQIGEKKQQARSLTEEELTSAFVRAIKGKVSTLCFLTGSGEHSIEDATSPEGYGELRGPLEKEGYKTESISLLQKPEIPAECTVLISGGPQTDYPQAEVDAITKFVQNGGRALLMLDAPLKVGRLHTSDNNALVAALQDWGVTLDKNFILDPLGERIGIGAFVTIAGKYNQHPIVRDIQNTPTGFPYARSLQVRKNGGWSTQSLCLSGQTAVSSTKLDSPEVRRDDPSLQRGPFIVGAVGTYDTTGRENVQGRYAVFGSSQWASNQFFPQPSLGNYLLTLNTIDWLASDEDLIAIRPTTPDNRPLTMNAAQFNWVLLVSLLLIPLAAIIAGITVWSRRR